MDVMNNLLLLRELISCNYNLYLWNFSSDFKFLDTNYPYDINDRDISSYLNITEYLSQLNILSTLPSIIETPLGIIWIIGFEYNQSKLNKYHLIGPAITGNTSFIDLSKKMDQLGWPIYEKAKIFRTINEIPIVPTNIFYQYAIMLHYCITGEKINSYDIQYPQINGENTAKDINNISTDHQGIWMAEQNLMKMIREGNPNYKYALEKSTFLSTGVKFDVGDSLRQKKSTAIVLLTLCSRATIEGGLSPTISFNLCDYYTQKIEESATLSSLTNVCATLLDDFVKRVQDAHTDNLISDEIQYICNFIKIHVTEDLSISNLAKEINYTNYYFSKKFKREVGCGVNEYIQKAKIEQAKVMLRSSTLSVNQISDELSFSSRSYFSTLFKSLTGESPNQFRDHYQNL